MFRLVADLHKGTNRAHFPQKLRNRSIRISTLAACAGRTSPRSWNSSRGLRELRAAALLVLSTAILMARSSCGRPRLGLGPGGYRDEGLARFEPVIDTGLPCEWVQAFVLGKEVGAGDRLHHVPQSGTLRFVLRHAASQSARRGERRGLREHGGEGLDQGRGVALVARRRDVSVDVADRFVAERIVRLGTDDLFQIGIETDEEVGSLRF